MSSIIASPRFAQAEIVSMMEPIVRELKQLDNYPPQWERLEELWTIHNNYDCVLYLMGLFLKGELPASIDSAGPVADNHQAAAPTLIKLNQLGVLTTDGQMSLEEHTSDGAYHQQRSYLDFAIRVSEDFDPLAFTRKLHDMGMQIAAHMMRPVMIDCDYIDHQITYFVFWDSLDIHGETTYGEVFRAQKRVPYDTFTVTRERKPGETDLRSVTRTPPDSFRDVIDFESMGWNHIYVATVVATEWDNTQCDELLLEALAE